MTIKQHAISETNRDAKNNSMSKNRLLNHPIINLQFITLIIVIVHLTVLNWIDLL